VLLLDKIELILPDMFGPEAVGWGVKVRRKGGDTAQRALDGVRGVVPQVEVFQHPLAECCHGETPSGKAGTITAWASGHAALRGVIVIQEDHDG
jgi:hypothetical protein